jgi:hypothetical protein
MDHKFKRGEPSSASLIEEVLEDLRKAKIHPYWRQAIKRPSSPKGDHIVLDWLELNKIDPETLQLES